jgi:hypothetical protein
MELTLPSKISFRVGVIILIVVLFAIIFFHLTYSCCSCDVKVSKKLINDVLGKSKDKEGFTGANTNYGASSPYSLVDYKPVSTKSWFTPDLTYKSGEKVPAGVANILNRPKQPVPLPPGELDMFATTEFKPQCCPNAYSNGSGCACMTMQQYNYLIDRGGNNVPYSEY